MKQACTFQIGDIVYCKKCISPTSMARRSGTRTFEFMRPSNGEKIIISTSLSEGGELEIMCEKCGSGYLFKDIPELSMSA